MTTLIVQPLYPVGRAGRVAPGYLEYRRRLAFLGLLEVPADPRVLWWERPEGNDAHETEAVVVDRAAYWEGLEET